MIKMSTLKSPYKMKAKNNEIIAKGDPLPSRARNWALI